MEATDTTRTGRVLVVDDQELIRESFALALRSAHLDVVLASTGAEALAATARERLDVVLLDAGLPDMAGEEVLAHIRAQPATTELPVLIVTGDPQLDRKLNGLRQGANDYLIKPVSLPELVARVRAQLDQRDRWLTRIDELLDTRRSLARQLSTVDPDQPFPPLTDDLLAILRDAIGAERLQVRTLSTAPPDGPTLRSVGSDTVVQVPLVAAGSVYATFEVTVPTDAARALSTMLDVAPQLSALLHGPLLSGLASDNERAAVDALLAPGELMPVFQPVITLPDEGIVGFEGLSRFRDGSRPLDRFRQAARVDQHRTLELLAVERMLEAAAVLPSDAWVSLNVSATALLTGALGPLLAAADRRVVLEITEHELVHDYRVVHDALGELPGVGLAVDDAGSGYASLRHIYELRPELIKLDREWVAGLDGDPIRRALLAGLDRFAEELGATLLAEGVETPAERAALVDLGIPLAQGYLFGRPSSPEHWAGTAER